jgi:peptidoglycan-N-acetylglucosamine deacetylase
VSSPSDSDPGATGARLTVALTFDHDAISDSIRRGDPPVKVSHGEFGPRVGAPRILALLASRGISSTWFVPGHTLEAFPESIAAIRDGGHELASHGWYHEDFAELAVDEQRDVLARSFEALTTARGGTPPTGWRAPYWSLGPRTLELVEAAGFRYDSSLMAGDVRPYRVRSGDRHSVVDGTSWGREGSLVEVPVYWAMDDWPHFEPAPERGRDGLAAPSKVLEIWTAELRYAYDHAPGGLLMLTMHPECIGRGHRMAMLEQFIDEASALDGVVFERLDAVVERFAAAGGGPG